MPRRQLTAKQQVFLRELLRNGNNAAAAYRLAFPDNATASSVTAAASRLRRHPLIVQALAAAQEESRRAVDAAVERYAISAERVADAMARLAFTDLRQVVDVSTVVQPDGRRRQVFKVRDFADIDRDAHQAIAESRQSPTGEVSVKLFNKLEALT